MVIGRSALMLFFLWIISRQGMPLRGSRTSAEKVKKVKWERQPVEFGPDETAGWALWSFANVTSGPVEALRIHRRWGVSFRLSNTVLLSLRMFTVTVFAAHRVQVKNIYDLHQNNQQKELWRVPEHALLGSLAPRSGAPTEYTFKNWWNYQKVVLLSFKKLVVIELKMVIEFRGLISLDGQLRWIIGGCVNWPDDGKG